jgi:hypothetical protein
MTHTCCPDCRLRFDSVSAAHLKACPQCGAQLQAVPALAGALGFRLFTSEDLLNYSLPEAIAVTMPIPDPAAGGS